MNENLHWEQRIQEFVEKYNLDADMTQDEIELFFEEGVIPLLEEYYLLLEASTELVEKSLEAFQSSTDNKAIKMRATPFTKALSNLLLIINKEESYQ